MLAAMKQVVANAPDPRGSSSNVLDAQTPISKLGGNHGLAEDPVTKLGLQGCRRDQIDRVPDDLPKLTLKANELEQPHGPVEFDEQIHVAVIPTFVTRNRTK